MNYDLFKIAGAVAGIGGVALAAVVYIFREVIRKEIFPQLTKAQAYSLLNRIVTLVFMIGVLGIVAYLILNWQNGTRANTNSNTNAQSPTPTPAVAELSGTVIYGSDTTKPIQGAKVTLDDMPGMRAAETSSDGVFTLKGIPKRYGETVRIRVIAEGYRPNPYTEDVVLGAAPPMINLTRTK